MAKRVLDWTPNVVLKDGLARTIAYFDRLLTQHEGRPDADAASMTLAAAK
jgi:hypothetical protein